MSLGPLASLGLAGRQASTPMSPPSAENSFDFDAILGGSPTVWIC